MCDYCDMTDVNVEHANKDYFIHKPFYLVNEYTHEVLKANGNNPVLYLREYRTVDRWSLICEFADNAGTVVESPVSHCPRCGRLLSGFINNNIKGSLTAEESFEQNYLWE